MGWDAFSSAPLSKNRYRLKYKKHREAFKKAHDTVKDKAKSVDGFLEIGGLDCSSCRDMLEKACGEYLYGAWRDGGMSSHRVRVANGLANWNFKYSKEDAWAYWSAKLFLNTCAELGLRIRYSY